MGKLHFFILKTANKHMLCVTTEEEHSKPIIKTLAWSCRWVRDDGSAGCPIFGFYLQHTFILHFHRHVNPQKSIRKYRQFFVKQIT